MVQILIKYCMERLLSLSISLGVLKDSQCQHQQWLNKTPDRKSIFAVNLPLKLFPATVNADIGSLKSLHTLFDKYLDHMLVKF